MGKGKCQHSGNDQGEPTWNPAPVRRGIGEHIWNVGQVRAAGRPDDLWSANLHEYQHVDRKQTRGGHLCATSFSYSEWRGKSLRICSGKVGEVDREFDVPLRRGFGQFDSVNLHGHVVAGALMPKRVADSRPRTRAATGSIFRYRTG